MDDVPAVYLPEDKSHHRNIPSIQNYQWPLSTIINQSLTHNPKLQLKRDSPWLTTFCPSQRYHLRIFELHALHGAQAVVVAVEARLFVSGFGHHLPGTVDKAWRIHQQGHAAVSGAGRFGSWLAAISVSWTLTSHPTPTHAPRSSNVASTWCASANER